MTAYFSKVFSNELSSESMELISDKEKFENITTMYSHAKNNNFPESFNQMLLYEALLISIKLEDYKEDLFKEYVKLPKEQNYNLKRQDA